MDWIYLSPHFDDVALSVGGLVWEQTQAGNRVAVWTIFGGDPPTGELSPIAQALHTRWGTGVEAIAVRRAEDIDSCTRLGAVLRHFDLPDCIYRRSPKSGQHLYPSEEALWIPPHPDEDELTKQLAGQMRELLPENARVVCPLTLGGHIDHRLVRAAAEQMGRRLLYYPDYPYAAELDPPWAPDTFTPTIHSISPAGLQAWQSAVAAHTSQISTFWPSLADMEQALLDYYQEMGGVVLFLPE